MNQLVIFVCYTVFHDRHLHLQSSDITRQLIGLNNYRLNNRLSNSLRPKGLQVLSNNTSFLWGHQLLISSFLLSVARWGVKSIWYFSKVHKLQISVIVENG